MTLNTARWIFVVIALIAALVVSAAFRMAEINLAFFVAMILPGAGLLCALSGADESSDMAYECGNYWCFKCNRWCDNEERCTCTR